MHDWWIPNYHIVHSVAICQTSYNDFFEVYITETVTLSPNIQTVYNPQTMARDHLKIRYSNS